MALFGRAKEPFLRRFLALPGGVPSHDPFSRRFRRLDPAAFEAGFARFVAAFAARIAPGTSPQVVAVDGKTARRSFDRRRALRAIHQIRRQRRRRAWRAIRQIRRQRRRRGQRPLHLISAWAVEPRLVLGQRKVDAASNQTRALPELRALLTLDGRIVTADAMHGHKATAQAILDRGGDDCRALKANQPALLADVRLLLDDPEAEASDRCATTDGDHGRIETRRAEVGHEVAWLAASHGFLGLQAVGKVTATRAVDGHATTATRYDLLATPLAAARFAEVVRTPWQIENRRHWVLDVVMDEDQARARKDHAPENLARRRRFALNLLRANPDQGSTRGKLKRAAWDDTFLLKILAAA